MKTKSINPRWSIWTSRMLKFVSFWMVIITVITVCQNRLAELRTQNLGLPVGYVSAAERTRQLDCLTRNIYWEAASEPFEGKVAVAQVTMNRVRAGQFGSGVCGVVYQKNIIYEKVVCQFSWYCDKRAKAMIDRNILTIENNSVYNSLTDLALRFYLYTETFKDPTKGAMFFHADYVKPMWSNIRHTVQIGRHIFYNKVSKKQV